MRTPQHVVLAGLALLTLLCHSKAAQAPELKSGVLTLYAGDYRVDFREAADWALGRIEYKGHPLVSYTGSNQSVINRRMPDQTSPEVWVGGAHRGERIDSLVLKVDGREHSLETPITFPLGSVYEFVKHSRLGPVGYEVATEVSARGIRQRMSFTSLDSLDGLRYAFPVMHCWAAAMNDWFALLADGKSVRGSFPEERGRHLKADIKALALYSASGGYGAVMIYAAPYQGEHGYHNFINNWPGRHNKHYLRMSPGQLAQAELGVFIAGFTATASHWTEVARSLINNVEFKQ